ncbi:MAG: hypothetical protein KF830_13395 [Planctomycetes bacterium]|nr:hypothetical protein [Planctomycetota bacterium]
MAGAQRRVAKRRTATGALVAACVGCGLVFAAQVGDVPLAATFDAVARAAANEPVVPAVANPWTVGIEAAPARTQIAAGEPGAAPDPIVVDPRIDALVLDLRDDNVPWNAHRAMGALLDLPPGRIPALEDSLRSHDLQQRIYAGMVLRARCDLERALPSQALFEVSTESLRSDVQVDDIGTFAQPLRATSLQFLLPHAAAASPALRAALRSDDRQQRVYAAFALAPAAARDDVPSIVAQLVGHLESNRIVGDAMLAAHGLYRLGEPALPALRMWRRHLDEQARSLIDLIEADLLSPPRDAATLKERGATARVSRLYHDAVLQYDITRSPLPHL